MRINRYHVVRIKREFTNLGKLKKQREKENNKRNKSPYQCANTDRGK